MIHHGLWSEDDDDDEEEEEGGCQDASEVFKLIRAANRDDSRQDMAVMLATMLQVLLNMLMSMIKSYKEQRSCLATSLAHLLTLQAVTVNRSRNWKRRRIEKEWWVKPRLLECDKFVAGRMDCDSSMRLFNMRPETFEWLCRQLAPLVYKSDTNFRSSIPPRKRIAIGIHRLACGSSYLEMSKMFAVGEATVLTCTRQVYAALSSAFGHVLTFPKGVALNKVILGFHALAALPNCCGVLSVVRFKLKRPSGPSGCSYMDSDGNYSIAAQLVVDASLRLLSVAVGFPGGFDDAKILKQSALFDKVRDGRLLAGPSVNVLDVSCSSREGVRVPQYLISDNGTSYPLLPWLMVPYPDQQYQEEDTSWKGEFNQRIKQVGMLATDVFQSLRTWQVLDKVMNVDLHTAVELVVACAILYNVLLDRDTSVDEQELGSVSETETMSAETDPNRIRDTLATV